MILDFAILEKNGQHLFMLTILLKDSLVVWESYAKV
jgi:hypothetical protein